MNFKDLKRDYIIESAKKLFLSSSIAEITIKDISTISGLGEATIYRYFKTKENLAIAVSLSLQKDVLKLPFEEPNCSGLKQIENFFNLFRNIFADYRDYFKFLYEFDTVYLKKAENKESKEYSLGLDVFYEVFMKSYEAGRKDGSIKAHDDIKLYYYTCTHSLLELCKKLASTDYGLKQDNEVKKLSEIEYLISISISVLKA